MKKNLNVVSMIKIHIETSFASWCFNQGTTSFFFKNQKLKRHKEFYLEARALI
jgi:hypothetical protein